VDIGAPSIILGQQLSRPAALQKLGPVF